MLFHWNMGIRCPNYFVKKIIRQFLGCTPSARTWGRLNSDQKSISLAAYYMNFLKARYIFYGKSEKFSPRRFSSTTDFLLTEKSCSNGNCTDLKNIWLKFLKNLRLKSDDLKWKNSLQRSVLNCKKSFILHKIHVVPLKYGYKVSQLFCQKNYSVILRVLTECTDLG